MEFHTLLIIKILVSIFTVLVLSYIAEALSSKWAGIIGGLPTGSAIMLYFYAMENGLHFASESALYNMIGLIAMQAFLFGYYISPALSRQTNIFTSTIFGLIFYSLIAFIISKLKVSPQIAVISSLISFFVFIFLFKNIKEINVEKKTKLTLKILSIRSIISTIIIVSITSISYLVGPQWSGIFSAFPATVFPLLIILHLSYGKGIVDAVIKHIPKGLGGLLIFSLGIHIFYSHIGRNFGMMLAFTGTMTYLGLYSVFDNWLKIRYFNKDRSMKLDENSK